MLLMTNITWLGSIGMKPLVGLFVLTLAACANVDEAPSGMSHPADPTAAAAKMPHHDGMAHDQMHQSMMDMDKHDMSAMPHDQMDHGSMEHGSMDKGSMDQSMMGDGHDHAHGMAPDQMASRPDGMEHDHAATAEVDRVVEVTAMDIAFEPKSVSVRPGETIRFVVTNQGAADHEFVIGDASAQLAHAEQMAAMGSGMDHSHMNAMLLKPGETKELVWTFEAGQDLQFACHVAGHYEAGMWGVIEIAR
jgi:uncharacterized cupredoxin-like copper-binding protein